MNDSLKLKWLAGSILFLLMMCNVNILYAATSKLSWNPPDVNSDGSKLTDLGGYVIYIGTSPEEYTQHIDVGNVQTYILSDLLYDITYYFAITAYDTSGNESDYSNQVSIMIESSAVTSGPEITISDSVTPTNDLQIQFGDITEFNSLDQTVTVKNDGNTSLLIGSVVQANPLSSSFSIFGDNCSFNSIPPSDTCLITVRFSPTSIGTFSETIDIPSNDIDESTITVALNGNGLSSAYNNPPSEPVLVAPKNRGKGKANRTGFKWKKASDPDGDAITYELNICQDPDMTTGCTTQTNIASVKKLDIYYAGIGSYYSGLLFFIISVILGFSKRSRQILRLSVVAISLIGMLFLVSCGKDMNGVDNNVITQSNEVDIVSDDMSQTISNLENGTSYYWQVIAKDSQGGRTYSKVWRFDTE